MKIAFRGLILASLFSSLGCSYAMEEIGLFKTSDIKIPNLGQPLPLAKSEQDKLVDFELVKTTALKSCLECHTAGRRSMDTADKVIKLQEDITFAIDMEMMPPKSSGMALLTSCEKQLLQTWLDNQNQKRAEVLRVKDLDACRGESSNTPTEPTTPSEPINVEPKPEPTVTPEPGIGTEPKPEPTVAPEPDTGTEPAPLIALRDLEPTFEILKERILDSKCLNCHTPGNPKKTMLDTVQALEKKNLISAKAEDSALYQIVVPDMYFMFMPPKKSGQPALTDEEVDFIKRWIDSRTEPASAEIGAN